MNWRDYQNQTAEFFRGLECDAEVEAKVEGARAKHKIDVWVRFRRFGIETRWVVECKYWNSPVTKEKVLVLRSVVEDVGADRGILMSSAGYQGGAIRAAEMTNISLTDLDGLKETAQEDLLASLLSRIESRATQLRYALHDLFKDEVKSKTVEKGGTIFYSRTSKPLRAVDAGIVIKTIGQLATLDYGFDRIRLKKPPYPVKFDDAGERRIAAKTLEEFVARASELISEVESTLHAQQDAICPDSEK